MKIICVTKDLKARLKEVFAEKKYNKSVESIQLQQIGEEVWLYRKYYTKTAKKAIVKCCKFSDIVDEPLKKTVDFCYGSSTPKFFEWLKYTDDLQAFDFVLNEDNLRAELNNMFFFHDDNHKGRVCFTMENVLQQHIIVEEAKPIVEESVLKTMKRYVNKTELGPASMQNIYIDDGVMVATDSKIVKIKDVESNYVGMVDVNGYAVNEGKFPNYKSIIPSGYKSSLRLNKKSLTKLLDSWYKQCSEKTNIGFDLGASGDLTLSIDSDDYKLHNKIVLDKQESKEPTLFYLRGYEFNRILKDKDLKEEFNLWYADFCNTVLIVQDKEMWIEMSLEKDV